jgi:eukaryotic-like serine/threonine-protein kinase
MQPTSGPPRIAERYRLVRSLGAGGMGRVWLARDEVLHRDVAVKEVIPPSGLTGSEGDEAASRGLREARAIARLSHPNVVRIYDVVAGQPRPWIVMEYVPSRSLQQILEQDGPLPPPEAARIGLGVLAALVAAHRAGVLHRDVKPSNVLLSEDRVVLTDFGLATLAGDSTLTRTGQILGSPAYIAPERARDGTTGPESDLWSLGATLYAAVEGRSPYQRSTAIATLTALATEPLPRPTRAGPLGRVLKGLLDKDPRTRMGPFEAERRLRRVAGPPRRPARPPAAAWPRPRRREAFPAAPVTPPTPVPTAEPAPPAPVSPAPPTAPVSPAPAAVGVASVPVSPAPPTAPVSPAPPGYRRLPVVALAVLAFFLLAAVVVGVALRQGRDHSTGAPPAGSTRAAASPSVPVASSAPASPPGSPSAAPPSAAPSTVTLPAGWHWYHDPTNFTVAVPDGWAMSRRDGIVYFSDPAGGRLLGIDQTDQPQMDPVADWTRQSQYRVAHGDFPGYQQIKIVHVDYHVTAADWEFTYDNHGVRTHVINRGAVFGPHQAYGFYWSTPDAAWAANLPNFDLITSTFQGQQD